ncbi:hypothetical protein Ocin01_05622 [Orchesella cincta]|uniref:Mucin-5AC n=1 Tax=Orchesella cincta TaxID=48709 RepID=A0A1D2N710_ORCCI|nr:hypothetical protein Ocin01_05622 [Orchesella cincta]
MVVRYSQVMKVVKASIRTKTCSNNGLRNEITIQSINEQPDATTNPAFQEEDLYEATTLPEEVPVETTTPKEQSKMVVNIITSAPRQSDKSTTSTAPPPTTTQAATTEAATTTTTSASTTTSEIPTTTTVGSPVFSSPKSAPAVDDKENLVADATQRAASSLHGFADSQAKLQAAESSQPARVNVRPAQNGKEYEYEYIYYYYDDDDENSTEKHAEPSVKAVGQNPEVIKQGSRGSTTLTPSTNAASSASSTTTVKTSTTTLRPQVSSDADFEYEDDAALDEEQVPEVPEIQKSTPGATRTTEAPISKGLTSAEKLSNQNPINQLDRSRGPKILQSAEKFDDAAADYKLEAEASQEEEAHVRSKGQPLRQAATSSEEDEQTADAPEDEVSREPSTSAPASTSGLDISQMSTLAKTHKDSVNVPIVIKQSSLLKAVPVSQLQSQSELAPERPSTSPFTTPSTTTTTTTVEAASEVVPSVRPSPPRLRGQRPRGNNATPRPTPASTPAPEQPAEEKPQQSIRRPTLRDSPRRIQSRRPVKESPEEIPEQQPAASPIIETHARPLPIRPRFPPRTGNHVTTTTAAPAEIVSEIPAAAVTPSAAELNSLEDKRTKDTHVRAKSANDLYAFTRLQQAISSRAPSRVQPKLVAGFVNSAEVTTDAMTSSEVTTVSSFGGQSSETVVDDAPSTTSTTTTTTTTTEAAQLDKFGRQRGRFGAGRTRRPGASATGGDGPQRASTTTTESPSTTVRGRFNGRRRSSTTTVAPEEAGQQQSSSAPAESPKPKLPARNRFASRNRGSTTETPVTTVEEQKTSEVEKPSTPAVTQPARRRPEQPGRNRFAIGGRARPNPAAGNNPVRIRGGGRLRDTTTTTTTTEATPEETQPDEEQPADAEQSPTIQSEHIEPAQNVPAPEAPAPVRGVLGRLKNRPKLVVTTTITPEAVHLDRKPGRLNGILNRRKNLGQLTAAAHVKEEVRETTSEVAEESDNHAQEVEDDHKGVVVQISSSVTESEEVNEAAGEVVEPSSTTTPGSILNRLKSQRKPGSLFRKKPDPHGE